MHSLHFVIAAFSGTLKILKTESIGEVIGHFHSFICVSYLLPLVQTTVSLLSQRFVGFFWSCLITKTLVHVDLAQKLLQVDDSRTHPEQVLVFIFRWIDGVEVKIVYEFLLLHFLDWGTILWCACFTLGLNQSTHICGNVPGENRSFCCSRVDLRIVELVILNSRFTMAVHQLAWLEDIA